MSFPEHLGDALQKSSESTFEGENLALVRTGGRTSQVEMGMRQIKTRPRPYSGM